MVQTSKIQRMKSGKKVYLLAHGAAFPKKKKVTTAKAVAKIAKNVIRRTIETKYVSQDMTPSEEPVQLYGDVYPQGVPGPPPGPNGAVQLFPVLPAVNEGTSEWERTGVKIQPTKLEVDLNLFFNTLSTAIGGGNVDSCSWDITAHVFYGYAKRFKNENDVLANQVAIVNNMLEDGQGNVLRWLGGPVDSQFKINKEYVNLKHKKVRMYRPFGAQNQATLAGGLTTYYPQKIHASMKLSFTPPKSLLYNETDTLPQNYAPFIIIGYCHNDNTQASNQFNASGPPALIAQCPALCAVIRSHMWYKDA